MVYLLRQLEVTAEAVSATEVLAAADEVTDESLTVVVEVVTFTLPM
jgi:hypothetical protein